MSKTVHFFGALIFCLMLGFHFDQVDDYIIDTDQSLSFFLSSGKGLQLYQELLDRPKPVEASIGELKEYLNVDVFDGPEGNLDALADFGETHPPLYYEILRLWRGASGRLSIAWSRYLSFFLITIASIVGGFIASELTKRSSFFWVGSSFILCSYNAIEQSGQVRMHILTLLVTGIFTLTSLRLFRSSRKLNSFAHYSSLTLGCLTTFFFPLYALPFVAYRIWYSDKPFKLSGLYLLGLTPFFLWMFFYGIDQLLALPYGDFSGISKDAHGLALEGWSPWAYAELFLYLGPLNLLSHEVNFPLSFVYILILALCVFLLKAHKRPIGLFFISPFVTVFVAEFLVDSIASQWADGRAMNFFLLSLLVLFTLSFSELNKRFSPWGIVFGLLICTVGFFYNYQNFQIHLLSRADYISDKVVQKIKERDLKPKEIVLLLNDAEPQVFRTILYLRNLEEVDVFFFDDLEDLAYLKLDLYRNVIFIFNPDYLKPPSLSISDYFNAKGFRKVEDLKSPSDYLESEDLAYFFKYKP